VTLFWDGVWPGSAGPFPVNVQALYPSTNFPIDTGVIDIYLAQINYCGYCGDGTVIPQLGEQCDPTNLTTADPGCCSPNCTFTTSVCSDLSLCNPVVCNGQGKCEPVPVTCTPIVDPILSLCLTNSCINGQCVVSCFGPAANVCCEDSSSCTNDQCVAGVCSHELLLECDCGGNPAFNSCFSCISNQNTTCGWDLATGSCVNVNITQLIDFPSDYGIQSNNNGSITIVTNQTQADQVCVAHEGPSSKVGIIVGVIAGVAALAALIALAAVFGGRLKQVAQRIFGSTSASGSSANKVLDNPAYEQAISGNSALYAGGGAGGAP